jgi:hypothetical protein
MASPSSTPYLIQIFLEAARPRLAYNPDLKAVFHQRGKVLLARIAQDLGYAKGGYDLRSNTGGIAVSGDITLHTDDLYIQFAQCCGGPSLDILYRDCKDRQDFIGGRNRFMRFDDLRDYATALARFAATKR